jgi:hypothetical protein
MKFSEISESTTAGAVASVAMPLGGTQKRAGSMFKGKKTKKKFYEGDMKRIATDMDELSDVAFKKKYGKTKDEMSKGLREEEIIEADLILMPGQIKGKDKSFIPHEKDRRDHEVEMARSELYAAAKDAMRVYKMIKDRSEDEGLMGWQQSYITLAADYLNSVADSLEHRAATEGAGVIAGGMSNFEESRPYNPLDYERREQAAMDQERRDFKRREMDAELRHEKNNYAVAIDGKVWKVFADEQQAKNIARSLQRKGKKATVHLTAANVSESMVEGKLGKALAVGAMSLASMGAKAHTDTTKSVADLAKERPAVASLLQKIGAQDQVPASDIRAAELQRKQDQEMPASDRRAKELEKNESKKHKCPSCGGEMVSEELMNEKKDACYYKVKSRYKVWPSAYASGALVKCRKKGAKNWGSKSKK